MALHRVSSKGSRGDGDKDEGEEIENNGYIQVFVKPLDQGNYSVILSWMGISNKKLSVNQLAVWSGVAVLVASFLLYQLIITDLGLLFQRLCGVIVPIFSIICGFYWVALYLRKCWGNTSIYVLFSLCFVGEFFGQCLCEKNSNYITQPILVCCVLVFASIASVFSTLETAQSTCVIVFVSFTRFLACMTLSDLPQLLRPYVAYSSGIVGVIAAKYMETAFRPPITNFMTQDGKIPVIKRRRSSSSSMHGFSAHRSGRRTSLPALIQKNQVLTVLSFTLITCITSSCV